LCKKSGELATSKCLPLFPCRLPPVPALPARDRAVLRRVERHSLATVERAARPIVEEGDLDGESTSVEALADRLDVTGRHLRRLFVRHWRAYPAAVAQTDRLQRAKR